MKVWMCGIGTALMLSLATVAMAARISMNKGSAEDLLSIPYTTMTPAQAEAVVAWRGQNGPFNTPEDVKKVPGMTNSVWVRMGLAIAPDGDVVWDPDLQEADEEQPPQMHGY